MILLISFCSWSLFVCIFLSAFSILWISPFASFSIFFSRVSVVGNAFSAMKIIACSYFHISNKLLSLVFLCLNFYLSFFYTYPNSSCYTFGTNSTYFFFIYLNFFFQLFNKNIFVFTKFNNFFFVFNWWSWDP